LNTRRENLERIDDPRPGPVEVRVPVGEEDTPLAHALPLGPGEDARKCLDLRDRSLEGKAAWLHEDDVRIETGELCTRHRWRPLAWRRDERRAARDRDELRRPHPADHDGFDPLDREDSRSRHRGG